MKFIGWGDKLDAINEIEKWVIKKMILNTLKMVFLSSNTTPS